jgi:glyceraldehyde-3-phosphate dehydrogenase/erythrose-4-phosphate dehydrogenase
MASAESVGWTPGADEAEMGAMHRPERKRLKGSGAGSLPKGAAADRQASALAFRRVTSLSWNGAGVDIVVESIEPDTTNSAAANCMVPVAKVIHEDFRIHVAYVTTVHAYSGDQILLEPPPRNWHARCTVSRDEVFAARQ